MKSLIRKYNHSWVLLYSVIYLVWFFYLNLASMDSFHPVSVALDARIPFNEWFIIPYYIWFPYIPIVVAYFFFTSKEEFYRCTAFLFFGMTICLIVYTIYPTGFIRPDLNSLGRDNILLDLTRFIYTVDPGTNVCPSIHCFNSIGVSIAILKSKRLKSYRVIRLGSVILSIFICMSTVFVKQHSILDFYCSVVLAAVMYGLVYVPNYKKMIRRS